MWKNNSFSINSFLRIGPKSTQFTWTDGTPFEYNNWANGEPNNGRGGTEFCVDIEERNI